MPEPLFHDFIVVFITCNLQVCRRKILNVGGDYRSQGYASVGPMAPFYVFPCGHAFHSQCLITHMTQWTDQAQVSSNKISNNVVWKRGTEASPALFHLFSVPALGSLGTEIK